VAAAGCNLLWGLDALGPAGADANAQSGGSAASSGGAASGDVAASATPASSGAGGDAGPGRGAGGANGSGGSAGAGGEVPACSESPCKLVQPQCGCDPNEKCTIDAANQRVCLAIGPEPAKHGEPCSDDAGCEAGAQCFGGAGKPHLCGAFCNDNMDCVAHGAGSKCIWKHKIMDQIVALTCTQSCSLIGGTGCPAGSGCRPVWDSLDLTNVGTSCWLAGAKVAGEACSAQDDCASGLICSSQICQPYCDVGKSGCSAGTTCQPFSTPGKAVIDGVEYGYCAPAAPGP
jgi:hypothetical protein